MCMIVAVGSKSEMEEKMMDEENQEETDPAKKKPHKEKTTKAKTPSQSVYRIVFKTPYQRLNNNARKATKKNGSIILVGDSTTGHSSALSALDMYNYMYNTHQSHLSSSREASAAAELAGRAT